jgi:hypothetical protein
MNLDRWIQLLCWTRFARQVSLPLILLSSLLDHVGLFGYRGDDWARFDGRSVRVDQVIDDDTFVAGGTTVRLLGVQGNTERATSFTESQLSGRTVTLRLDWPQTRDGEGNLLAYAYLSPSDCWNLDLIRSGGGYADRQSRCWMLPTLVDAQWQRDRSTGAKARRAKV